MAEGIKVNKGDGNEILVDGENFTQKSDAAANDSDKTLTVPAGKTWALQFLTALLVTTGAGTRQMRIEIGDGTNLLWFKNFGDTQPASSTYYYYAAAGLPDDSGEDADDRIRMELEAFILPAGYTVRIFDSAAIAPTVDDLTIRLVVDERNAGAAL